MGGGDGAGAAGGEQGDANGEARRVRAAREREEESHRRIPCGGGGKR